MRPEIQEKIRLIMKNVIKRILSLAKKEFIQLRRNAFVLRLIFFAPIFQLTIFGYAAIFEVNNIDIIILDRDNSHISREFKDIFKNSNYFVLKDSLYNEEDILKLFRTKKIYAAVIIPPDFAKCIKSGKVAKVQIIIDGSDSPAASAAQGYVQGCVFAFNANLAKKNGVNISDIRIESRFLYNPSLNNRYFFIPGVFAMIIFLIGMPITAMSIVREKEEGTYEQLTVTPIGAIEIVIGKIIPYVFLIFFASGLLLLLSLYWFGLPLRGNLIILICGIVLFLFNVLGLGILVSLISENQQQAMLTSFFILLPAILFSGFMFPIDNMPDWSKVISHIDPMTHFLHIARQTFLKGGGWEAVKPALYTLSASGFIIFGLSLLLTKKRAG